MDAPADSQCQHTKADGQRCRARCRIGRAYCFVHDPASQAERQAARSAGGRKRAVMPAAADVTFASVADVTRLIAETASQVRRGEIDVRVANSLFYGASVAARILQPDDEAKKQLEQQMEELKRKVTQHDDLFTRVGRFADVIRQLGGQAADAAPADADAGPDGAGVAASPVPHDRLRELLAAAPADAEAGGVPV